ncbi:hypothetical protein QZH41_002680 [Actinostola sp. cb2023]|nr:hypothetical protein QZH41_002680 [Actinostola sp. cb2023]
MSEDSTTHRHNSRFVTADPSEESPRKTTVPTALTRTRSTTKGSSTPSTKTLTSSPTLPSLQRPENYDLQRTFCAMKLRNGLMCPRLYTELGGECSDAEDSKVICTDVRRMAFHRLRQAQLAMTRLLGLLDLVARKHNITYWLTSATLLGAVRHKGFIPWDSDVDIEIPLDQYEQFFKNASRDLPADVFFQNTESDPNLRPEELIYESNKYKDIGMYIRTWNPRLRDRKSCYKYCIAHGCKWHDGLMIDMYIVESIPKGTFPLKEVLFEGLRFPVPNNWRKRLVKKYGDNYMLVPREGSNNRFQWDWPDPVHSCEELMGTTRGTNTSSPQA